MSAPLPPSEPLAQTLALELRTLIEPLAPLAEPPARGRPRILPSLALWAGLLVCVAQGFSSQLALWRLLSARGLWSYPRFPVSDQAVYKRLAQEGTAPLERLFARLSQLLAARLAPLVPAAFTSLAPFATEVMALDETTLDQVARTLPALRGEAAGASTLLGGALAGLFDVRRQQWRRVVYRTDPRQNEKVLARELACSLPRGSLVLADLGYFGFAWFDDLTEAGYYWVSRLRAKTSLEVVHVFFQHGSSPRVMRDCLVWLGADRADRAKHLVRLVEFPVGGMVHRYLTNVLDPHVLPAAELAQLYARRWDFELAVKLVKRHLGLHLLWSAKPVVIQQQVWATLCVAQVLHALQLEIAWRAACDPFEVSLPLLVEYLPRFAARGLDPVAAFVTQGRALRFIRPSTRVQPRTPPFPLAVYVWPPPDLPRTRVPRYAGRP